MLIVRCDFGARISTSYKYLKYNTALKIQRVTTKESSDLKNTKYY